MLGNMRIVFVLLVSTVMLCDVRHFGAFASSPEKRAAKAKADQDAAVNKIPSMSELQTMNLENAIKIYLAARGVLTPVDLTTTSPAPAPASKHALLKRRAPKPPPCVLPEGCVKGEAKLAFLKNKYIPGNDNILSPYYQVPGHTFLETNPGASEILNADMRLYLMSRPRSAVPDAARQLLMPEGDEAWPGGNGGDRTAYYPKSMLPGQVFWETDLDPIKGADAAMPSPPQMPVAPEAPAVLSKSAETMSKAAETVKDVEETVEEAEETVKEDFDGTLEKMGDMSPDEIFDLMVWLFLVMSMIIVPLVLVCVCRSFYSRPDQAKRLDMAKKKLKNMMA